MSGNRNSGNKKGHAQNRVPVIHYQDGPFKKGVTLACGKRVSDTTQVTCRAEELTCHGCIDAVSAGRSKF